MPRREIVRFWGKDNLGRWSEESFTGVDIPPSSRSFLSDVGLPLQGSSTLRFEPDDLPVLPNHRHYRRIGYDDVVPLCIDEHENGRVLAVQEVVGGNTLYVNADVERFAECLMMYEQYRTAVRGLAEGEAVSLIAKTEQRMRTADPTAFEREGNWWPLIIEQMKQGLL